jgi:predicted DNA-binding transcriptional regulator YafY
MYEKKLGIKLKTYEKELQRMQFYINPEHRVENRNSHFKVFGFSYDRYRNDGNYLITSYKLKTYTQKFLLLYFAILQILESNKYDENRERVTFSLGDIAEKLSLCEITEDEKELGRKINEICEAGLIEQVKADKKTRYRISDNVLDKFTSQELQELYYALDLYSNKEICSVPGMFLMETIKTYLKFYRSCELSCRSIFVFEYNFIHKLLNDNIVSDLCDAIDKNQSVKIVMYQKSADKKDSRRIAPCKILCEYWYGRQYLLGVDLDSHQAVHIRIDRIQSVTAQPENYNAEAAAAEMLKFGQSWCVTLPVKENAPAKVEIEFYYDEASKYIRTILEYEKRWGTIEDIDEEHCLFVIEVNDPTEMKPWIRRFGEHAKVRCSEKHRIAEELEDDWKEALIKYGVISEE